MAMEEGLLNQKTALEFIGQRFRLKAELPDWVPDDIITKQLLRYLISLLLARSCNKYFIISIVSVSFVYCQYVELLLCQSLTGFHFNPLAMCLHVRYNIIFACIFGDFFQGIGISSLGQER